MIQYIRLKLRKDTGNRIRLYLSMSDGEMPNILCRFLFFLASDGGRMVEEWGKGTENGAGLPPPPPLFCIMDAMGTDVVGGSGGGSIIIMILVG